MSYQITESHARTLEKHNCRYQCLALSGQEKHRAVITWTPTGEPLHTAEADTEEQAVAKAISKLVARPPGARVSVMSDDLARLEARRAELERENAELIEKMEANAGKNKPANARKTKGEGEPGADPTPEPVSTK